MQAAPLARWRLANAPLRGAGVGVPVFALLPLALLLLLGLPQGRPAAQTPRGGLSLLTPRRQPLPPSLEAAEAALEAEALAEEALAEEAEEEEASPLALAAKRQQHQFDDYGHMRFGKRTQPSESQSALAAPIRAGLRRHSTGQALPQRVRKFDDYGHMRFGRSSEK